MLKSNMLGGIFFLTLFDLSIDHGLVDPCRKYCDLGVLFCPASLWKLTDPDTDGVFC